MQIYEKITVKVEILSKEQGLSHPEQCNPLTNGRNIYIISDDEPLLYSHLPSFMEDSSNIKILLGRVAKSFWIHLPRKSEGEAANPVAAAAAKCPKCKPGCWSTAVEGIVRCGLNGLVAVELELELSEAGDSARFCWQLPVAPITPPSPAIEEPAAELFVLWP